MVMSPSPITPPLLALTVLNNKSKSSTSVRSLYSIVIVTPCCFFTYSLKSFKMSKQMPEYFPLIFSENFGACVCVTTILPFLFAFAWLQLSPDSACEKTGVTHNCRIENAKINFVFIVGNLNYKATGNQNDSRLL